MNITEEILLEAEKRALDVPPLNGSVLGEPAKIIGAIGEVLFEKFIKANGLTVRKEEGEQERYNHDFVVDEKFKVEVKTKDRSTPPKGYYDCSVFNTSLKNQKPDYFYFISLLKKKDVLVEAKFTEGFMLGATDLLTLYRKGDSWKKGEVDARNGKVIQGDCQQIEIYNLIGNEEFINILKGENHGTDR